MTDPASDKILLVLVGLPARGKSYVAHKLSAFMQWKGIACKSFNVGALRRKAVHEKQTADFFSGDNEDAKQKREAVALEVLHSALEWLSTGGGSIAILDATNTTRRRRTRVQQSVVDFFSSGTAHLPYVVFVECICNNETVLASNMLQKVTNSPDYRDMPVATALADLRARVAEYERVYETVDETLEDAESPIGPLSYIKTIDLQSKIICRNIWGSTALMIVSFLMVIHVGARPIYLVRAGQCTDDVVRAMIKKNVTESSSSLSLTRKGSEPGEVAGSPAPLHMYQDLASLSASMASTALSAGLTLNESGKRFAHMLADFVLRRTAEGTTSTPTNAPKTPAPSPADVRSAPPSVGLSSRERSSNGADLSPLKVSRSSHKNVMHVSLLDSMRPVKINVVERVSTPVATPALLESRGATLLPATPAASRAVREGQEQGFVVKKVRPKASETHRMQALVADEMEIAPLPLDVMCVTDLDSDDMVDDEDAEAGIVASEPRLAQASHYDSGSRPETNSLDLVVFDAPPAIYTSTLPRTIEMAEPMPFESQQLSALNPMETGICLGIPLQYLKSQFPDEYARWQAAPDRARYRITGGESLMDVVARLTPLVLLSYFKGVPVANCVDLDFPMNTVIEFSPHQYGWLERRFTFTKVVSSDAVTSKNASMW